ncbi:adenosylcobinamide-phosphate synthase CbiB [Dietzia alimentaria]|uniref:adenosylcobinamide-phosphate synthase CbiB n=1 Tax=Dietzia alimentaria TaxID=665550 RepID=UPI00029A5E8A|nr:adenosylcobinamide-phosphate synthase CbiB [Dietzia alimentaria]
MHAPGLRPIESLAHPDGTTPLTRALGLGLAVLLDRLVGDPQRLHPVAGFGRVALAMENFLLDPRQSAARQRAAGLAFTGLLVGGTTAATFGGSRLLSRSDSAVRSVLWNAAVVWSCLGGTSLLTVARRQDELLRAGDHDGSRALLPWLCGRDPDALDPDGLARAVVESVAENTSDAAVATLFWAAVAGPAGAAAHRAANTLDAMVGHRSPRYQHFGTASARLDDVLGFLPARLAGLVGVAAAGTVGGSPTGALRAWRRDSPAHPSPNAGVVEAVCAGALGVRLGGPTPYPYGVQDRAVLGDGRPVQASDIGRAVRLHDRVQLATAGLMIFGLLTAHRRTAHRGR